MIFNRANGRPCFPPTFFGASTEGSVLRVVVSSAASNMSSIRDETAGITDPCLACFALSYRASCRVYRHPEILISSCQGSTYRRRSLTSSSKLDLPYDAKPLTTCLKLLRAMALLTFATCPDRLPTEALQSITGRHLEAPCKHGLTSNTVLMLS